MSEELSIEIRERGDGRAVIAVGGEADFDSSPALVRTCTDLIGRGTVRLVLDLSGLEFADSSGVRALVLIRKQAVQSGGDLALAAVGRAVDRILALSGADAVISSFPTVHGALDAMGEEGAGLREAERGPGAGR